MKRPLGPRLGVAVAILATASLHVNASRGAPAPSRTELHVERGEGADACPHPATFAARAREGLSLTSELDQRPETSARRITVRFERTTAGYASHVKTSDGMERSLDDRASGCEGLAEATLLAVRLAFDAPLSSLATSPPPSPPKPQVIDEGPIAPRAERAARASPRRLEALVGGVAAFGIGSPFAPGVRLGAALVLGDERQWAIGVTGWYLAPRTESLGGGQVEIGVAGGGVEGCRRRHFENLMLGLCARAEIARLSGAARAFAGATEAARPLGMGSLLLRAQARIAGPIRVFTELGGVVPLVQERFEIQGLGLVYDPPPVALASAIGLAVDF